MSSTPIEARRIPMGDECALLADKVAQQIRWYNRAVQQVKKNTQAKEEASQKELTRHKDLRQQKQVSLDSINARLSLTWSRLNTDGGPGADNDALKSIRDSFEYVKANGGIDVVKREVKAYDADADKAQTQRKTPMTAKIKTAYKETLKTHSLVINAAYLVDWDKLQGSGEWGINRKRGLAVARVLGHCELPSVNSSADPSKIHLQLALMAGFRESTQLYVKHVDGAMQRITDGASAADACRTVFDASNIKLLYESDSAFHEGVSYGEYETQLRRDTTLCITTYLPHVWAYVATMAGSSAGRRCPTGKRVDYTRNGEGSSSKRSRRFTGL